MRLDIPFTKYAWHSGTIAWLLHRITGGALIFYLTIHVWVTHHLGKGPEEFDQMMKLLMHPAFRIGEIGLLAAIVYHSLNGVRILLVDLGIGARHQEQMFWWVIGLSFVLCVLGGIELFPWYLLQNPIFKGLLP
ncbi:MAG: succinate dehydrogenase, cytochrome b556 subunit [Proteobacteria bacterium]|nr:succinate dehydrogenase, cytochrome b556 subunit [Pseudomonadota bacterium]